VIDTIKHLLDSLEIFGFSVLSCGVTSDGWTCSIAMPRLRSCRSAMAVDGAQR
jgi:hypothetical protein